MKKKTFFMRTYTFITYLLFISSICGLFSVLLHFSSRGIKQEAFFSFFETILQLFCQYAIKIGLGSFLIAFLLIVIEVIHRLKKDCFINYGKSIIQTFLLRKFLKQHQPIKKDLKTSQAMTLTIDPVLMKFNIAVRKCTIDVQKESVIALIKLPKNQQAQKQLQEMMPQITDEIAHNNPEYYFSTPHRIRHELWIIGKKRHSNNYRGCGSQSESHKAP